MHRENKYFLMSKINKVVFENQEVEILTISAFIDRFNLSVTNEAVGYAINQGKIDGSKIGGGRERFVLLTEKSKSHNFNFHPAQNKKVKNI